MDTIRVAYESAMNGYVDIQEDDMVEDEFARVYQPKIDEMEKNMGRIEEFLARTLRQGIEARAAKEASRDSSPREPGVAGTSHKWKIVIAFKLQSKMNLEMTMQELQLWQETWEQYYNVSNLHQAPFDVQKAAFLQCVSDYLKLRIDFSTCASVKQLLTLLETEFKIRNS